MPAVRRIYNKARSAKLYKEDTLNSSKLIVLRPGTIWVHFTQLNFLLKWHLFETSRSQNWINVFAILLYTSLNFCLIYSYYSCDICYRVLLLLLLPNKKILVTFAIFANFVGFQMTFFTFPFKKSQLFLNLLFFLFLRYLLACFVVVVVVAAE